MRKLKTKHSIFQKTNGITLIALVITIAILIILAVIAIDVAFGEDGLIAQAQKSKEEAENMEISDREKANMFFMDSGD